MTIVRNKFEVWSFSLRPELTQCCTSTSCESWPRTPPHGEPFLFQSLAAFMLKRRSSNAHFEMVDEPLSLAAWRSFERRDRTEKDWLMTLVSTWKICGQSLTKRRCCSSKRTFHNYSMLVFSRFYKSNSSAETWSVDWSNMLGIDPYRHQFLFPCWIIRVDNIQNSGL